MLREIHCMRKQRPWLIEEDALLLVLFRRGDTINEIGRQMRRSEGSIRCRLGPLRAAGFVGHRRPPMRPERSEANDG